MYSIHGFIMLFLDHWFAFILWMQKKIKIENHPRDLNTSYTLSREGNIIRTEQGLVKERDIKIPTSFQTPTQSFTTLTMRDIR
jgi:hypothetical protein